MALPGLFLHILRTTHISKCNARSCIYCNHLKSPVVYSTGRSKAVAPVLVLLFVALWFTLRGDLCYVIPCVILFLCFSVLLALRLPRLGKRELILVLLVLLFDMCLFGFVCFLFLLMSGRAAVCDCGTPWTFFLPFLCYFVRLFFVSGLLTLRLPRLGKRELILVLFVCLFDLRLFGFVYFFFFLVSGKGCGL